MMFDFSSAGIRVLVGVVVIILGFMVLRFMSADGEETITPRCVEPEGAGCGVDAGGRGPD